MTSRSLEDLRHLERAEATGFEQLHRCAPPGVVETLGLGCQRIGGTVIGSASRIDILMFNRALGIGIDEPADAHLLDAIHQHFVDAPAPRYFIQVAPSAEPRDLTATLLARGLVLHNRWAKLARDASPPPAVETDLTIAPLELRHASEYGSILAEAFEHPMELVDWYAATVGIDGWKYFAALDGDTVAAVGSMHVEGEVASLAVAATRPAYRGRGAQGALIARRIREAIDQGCRLLVVETAEDTAEKPSASFRNLRRFGFELVYLRENYLGTTGVAPAE